MVEVNDKEILKFFELHSRNETKREFGISTRTLKAVIAKNNYHKPDTPEVREANYRRKVAGAEKTKKILLEKYGVESFAKIPEHHKKMVELSKTPEAKEKRKETYLKKYGYEYANQNPEVKEKIRKSLEARGLRSGRSITIPEESRKILYNGEKLREFIESFDKKERSKTIIGGKLGISRQTLGRYTAKYQLNYLFSKKGTSEGEERLAAIIRSWGIEVIRNSRKFLPPTKYSLDIYLPQFSTAIEYQGSYWHSLPKKIEQDKRKKELCKEHHITLFEVWDKDFIKNTDKVVLSVFKFLGLDKFGQLVLGVEEKHSDDLIPFYDIEVESENHNFLTEAGIVHNSVQFGQDLASQGINYKQQSIDRVVNGINPTYEVLQRAIYEGRIELLDDEDQTTELLHLERHESGKVDKPLSGGFTDDASQALCGAVYGCSQFKEEVLFNGSVLIKALASTEGRKPEATPADIQKEIERSFSQYSLDAIKVDRPSSLKQEMDAFFGKDSEKKKNEPNRNYTGYWG